MLKDWKRTERAEGRQRKEEFVLGRRNIGKRERQRNGRRKS